MTNLGGGGKIEHKFLEKGTLNLFPRDRILNFSREAF